MKRLLTGILIALAIGTLTATSIFAAGLPAGKFWQVIFGVPEAQPVDFVEAPASPWEIMPGLKVELVEFGVQSPTPALLTDIAFGFFYDSRSKAAGASNFRLYIREADMDWMPLDVIPVPDSSQTVKFLSGNSLRVTGPVMLKVLADVSGTGTIKYVFSVKVLSDDGNPMKTTGLPFGRTLAVNDTKVAATLSATSPLGVIPPGARQTVLNIDISATGEAEVRSLSVSLETLEISPIIYLFNQTDLIGTAVASYGLASVTRATFNFPPEKPLILPDGSTTQLSFKMDLFRRGKLTVALQSMEALSRSTATIVAVQNLPVVGSAIQISGPSGPVTLQVPGEYAIQEAYRLAVPGDTIALAPGRYGTQLEVDGFPALPGGVTIKGAGEDKTFVYGRIITEGDATRTTGDVTLKNLTLIGPPSAKNVIQAGKLLTLDNVTVLVNGSVGAWAGWKDVVLDVHDSTFIHLQTGASIGIEVAGELDSQKSVVARNTFVNFSDGMSVPVKDFEGFAKKVIPVNFFFGVERQISRSAFG